MEILTFIAKVFILLFALLEAVSTAPQLYKASDGKEYLIETALKYNWYQAWHECARRDFQLLVIDSAQKNNVIFRLLNQVLRNSHNLWLGGNDEYNPSSDYNRPFFWSATGKRFTFTFWAESSPDNYRKDEHCVHIWQAHPLFKWNDIACTSKMGFICEVNHYVESYNQDLKNKCEAVKQSNSSISIDFNEAHKQQLSAFNTNAN